MYPKPFLPGAQIGCERRERGGEGVGGGEGRKRKGRGTRWGRARDSSLPLPSLDVSDPLPTSRSNLSQAISANRSIHVSFRGDVILMRSLAVAHPVASIIPAKVRVEPVHTCAGVHERLHALVRAVRDL